MPTGPAGRRWRSGRPLRCGRYPRHAPVAPRRALSRGGASALRHTHGPAGIHVSALGAPAPAPIGAGGGFLPTWSRPSGGSRSWRRRPFFYVSSASLTTLRSALSGFSHLRPRLLADAVAGWLLFAAAVENLWPAMADLARPTSTAGEARTRSASPTLRQRRRGRVARGRDGTRPAGRASGRPRGGCPRVACGRPAAGVVRVVGSARCRGGQRLAGDDLDLAGRLVGAAGGRRGARRAARSRGVRHGCPWRLKRRAAATADFRLPGPGASRSAPEGGAASG